MIKALIIASEKKAKTRSGLINPLHLRFLFGLLAVSFLDACLEYPLSAFLQCNKVTDIGYVGKSGEVV